MAKSARNMQVTKHSCLSEDFKKWEGLQRALTGGLFFMARASVFEVLLCSTFGIMVLLMNSYPRMLRGLSVAFIKAGHYVRPSSSASSESMPFGKQVGWLSTLDFISINRTD